MSIDPKFAAFGMWMLGLALINWGVKQSSPYIGGMFIAAAFIGWVVIKTGEK